MASSRETKAELLDLFEALCEERLTADQFARLESLLVKSRSARKLYLDYIHLHGTLHWDAAQSDGVIRSDSVDGDRVRTRSLASVPSYDDSPAVRSVTATIEPGSTIGKRAVRHRRLLAVSAAICIAVVSLFVWWGQLPTTTDSQLAVAPISPSAHDSMYDVPRELAPHYRPFPIDRSVAENRTEIAPVVAPVPSEPKRLPLDMVAFVDDQLQEGWSEAGVQPSEVADDAEWLRRVFLDLVGHIPSATDVEKFLTDRSPAKRQNVVDRLLASDGYNAHFATVWTNLLVGRSEPRVGSRKDLFKYLQSAFAENQPWDATVAAFISAEGAIDSDPAANFLVAHLNNQAVPATAITARVFLSTQVQCMQCHNHPFNDWTQQDFWEMNSFFQQTKLTRNEAGKPALVSDPIGGATLFETRNGLMKVAYPKYLGREISSNGEVNRRKEFARLIAEGEKPQLAVAFVNRTWAQLLGAGFTNPIDDMGPHNPPSHPAALDALSRGFVASGYDVKKLVRWITSTKAYQLSSRANETNANDAPSAGEPPLFSRAYTKPMTVEQVYDSLIIATRAEGEIPQLATRDEWVKQFVRTYETDENDESVHFQGSIPAALALMNGEVVQESLNPNPGTTLHQVLATPGGDEAKLQALAVATLSRRLTEDELSTFRRLIRQQVLAAPTPIRKRVAAEAYQDVLWAMLNSGEFVTVP